MTSIKLFDTLTYEGMNERYSGGPADFSDRNFLVWEN